LETIPCCMKKEKRAVLWFRQDLRLDDNEALHDALGHSKHIIPVYVFDERLFKGTTYRFGFPKTGKFRAKFILESVADLRRSLQRLGTELVVRVGKPEEIVFNIAREAEASWVFCNRERMKDELFVQDQLEKKLWSIGQELRFSRGKMLYYTADLPFPVSQAPDNFASFRKEVEKMVGVRKPLPTPDSLLPLPSNLPAGNMPALSDFGHAPFKADPRATTDFKGGETEAKERLHEFVWQSAGIKHYATQRNSLLDENASSKLSPWLAQGCISPKTLFHEVALRAKEEKGTDGAQDFVTELLRRDFLRLMGKKHGNCIFNKGGIQRRPDRTLTNDSSLFMRWAEGRTGAPFIDANMRELNMTGYISYRGRLNTAVFLSKELKVNWLMGAEYFESLLLDYDACSNYGNWNALMGVGSDPREERSLNILAQSRRYDPKGEFIRLWLPELAALPDDRVHWPHAMSDGEQRSFGLTVGDDYPLALANLSR
jgi:deoxyribodipyrimidine photo-lyase